MAPHGNSDMNKNPFKAIIAGGITGGIEICITYPTEYVKTQMQLYPDDAKKGLKYIISSTYQKYNVFGFYRGLSALVLFSIPKTASRFGSNEWLKNHVFKEKTRLNTFLAGLGAGMFEATLVVTPAETLKVKLIHDRFQEKPKYRGLFHGIYTIVKQQGIGGCYKGLFPTILKQGSNQGVRFLVYEDTKKFMLANFGFLPTVVNMLISGGIAGAASVFANTPVDVIKTNMQGLKAHQYKNSIDCAVQIVKSEGIKGLYKGTVPRLGRVVLDVAITFTLYDYITKAILHFWPNKSSGPASH